MTHCCAPHRHPRRHVRSDSLRPSRRRRRRGQRAEAVAAVRRSRRTSRRTGRSRSPRRTTASRWSRSRCWIAPDWRAADLELRPRRAVVHLADAASCSTSAATCRPSCSSSSAPTRSPRSRAGATTPAILDAAHFAVVSRPGLFGRRSCRGGCRGWRDRMARPPLDEVAQIDPLIILIDAPTADVSSTAIRAAAGRAANRSPGWCRRACSNTLNTTDFTRR